MKDKNIHIQNLALELTRQCNLNCGHCSRGEAENHVMSDEIMEKLFDEITTVDCLQFIGGESSLVVDRINKLAEILTKNGTDVFSCLVFTNATNVSDEYIEALNKLKKVVKETNERKSKINVEIDYKKQVLQAETRKNLLCKSLLV